MSRAVLLFFGVLSLLCYGAVSLFEHNILCSVMTPNVFEFLYISLSLFLSVPLGSVFTNGNADHHCDYSRTCIVG